MSTAPAARVATWKSREYDMFIKLRWILRSKAKKLPRMNEKNNNLLAQLLDLNEKMNQSF